MAIYTFTIYKTSGFSGLITDSVTITVDDSDDDLGIGDRWATDIGFGSTETGAYPTITAISDPAFNSLIGSAISFDEEFHVGGGPSGYGGFIVGFGSHAGVAPDGGYYVAEHPDNPGALTVGDFLTRAEPKRSVAEARGRPVMACFTAGTLIETRSGTIAIENLSVGDMVQTMEHGEQPIRWIGSAKCAAIGNRAPILIQKGALGNARDLRVSPQHRMLLDSAMAELYFGEHQVLVAAKHLVNDSTIRQCAGGTVVYYHMMFDTHEIVSANGCPSESFHPGEVGLDAMGEATRQEIFDLFPP